MIVPTVSNKCMKLLGISILPYLFYFISLIICVGFNLAVYRFVACVMFFLFTRKSWIFLWSFNLQPSVWTVLWVLIIIFNISILLMPIGQPMRIKRAKHGRRQEGTLIMFAEVQMGP